jgi:lipopolysaccharide transport system permease protein
MFLSLWKYRGFVFASARREFEARYRVSLLGGIWAILNPLAQIAIYAVILAGVMQARMPGIASGFGYTIYLCAGIITWGFFAEIVGRSTGIFVDNANLLKKLSFPRICLPATVVLSASVNFAIVFVLFLLFLLVSGNTPGWELLGVLPVLLVQTLFAVGLGVFLGVANVFFRDVAQGVGIAMQFWFWLTPIIYPMSIVPEWVRPVIRANPMTPLAVAYQDILLAHRWPEWGSLVVPAVVAFLVGVGGFIFFRKRVGEMVDEL